MPSAQRMVSQGVGIVVGVIVTLLATAFLVPVALEELNDVNTDDWSAGTAALWGILGLIAILVIFLTMIGWAVSAYQE